MAKGVLRGLNLGRMVRLAATWALWTCVSCSSSETPDPEDVVGPTHYTLEAGAAILHTAPLPDETPIFVKWHQADGTTKKVEAYRGWDFNGDRRFEMVEVLNAEGTVESWVYDFDADGIVDAVRGVEGGGLPIAPTP